MRMKKFSLILSGPRERYQYEREDFLIVKDLGPYS